MNEETKNQNEVPDYKLNNDKILPNPVPLSASEKAMIIEKHEAVRQQEIGKSKNTIDMLADLSAPSKAVQPRNKVVTRKPGLPPKSPHSKRSKPRFS
ncbi:hypothetical protein FGM00_11190 [Aggregatimonas sangjinii]|uniref:Uncharacterized protein n=1 Tax=Aggregatimonas sangjinii TaxID=2583587 RepID=A0A5B7SUR6_9FLAO|nr:hypothetical protein [Aggregatimonas sangjinii]QCX00641.1 hypothetical protein FGM00_11190 [Aggregatimonas sangjinii]